MVRIRVRVNILFLGGDAIRNSPRYTYYVDNPINKKNMLVLNNDQTLTTINKVSYHGLKKKLL